MHTMDLNEKIKSILESKKISPSHFADEIGIQRSSVSHILAGRNKPSLDIIQKIIRRFPELGFNWIMDEVDMPPLKPENNELDQLEREDRIGKQREIRSATAETAHPYNDLVENSKVGPKNVPTNSTGKQIERILILYTDSTFQEFKS